MTRRINYCRQLTQLLLLGHVSPENPRNPAFVAKQAETIKVIDECNGHWKALVDGKTEAGKMWIK